MKKRMACVLAAMLLLAVLPFGAAAQETSAGLTQAEQEYLQNQQEPLTVLFNPDRAPYTYVEKGEIQGVFYDLMEMAAQEYGLQFEPMVTHSTEEYYQAVNSGKADIIFDLASSAESASRMGYNVTQSYYVGTLARLQRKGTGEKRTVAVKRAASDLSSAYVSLYGDSELLSFDTLDACVEAVKQGQADCCYLYIYSAAEYVSRDYRGTLEYMPMLGSASRFRIAVRQDLDESLLSILDRFAANVSDGTMNALFAADRRQEEPSLVRYIYRNPIRFTVTVLALSALAALLVELNHRRAKRQMEERDAEIRALKDMLDQMTTSFPMGIFAYTLPQREVLIANEECCRLFGHRMEKGRLVRGSELLSSVLPEDLNAVGEATRVLQKPGDAVEYSFRTRLADSSIADVVCVTRRLAFENGSQYILSGMRDNTEQVRSNRQLRQERAQFRDALLKTAQFSFGFDVTLGFITRDVDRADGEPLFASQGYTLPIRYDDMCRDLIEKLGVEFADQQSGECFSCEGLRHMYSQGRTAEISEYRVSRSDSYYSVQVLLSTDTVTGHLKATVINRDLTQVRKDEIAQRQLLKEALAATDRANAAKTEFMSQMSHDIRTPMNGIVGMTAIAKAHLDQPERVADCLKKIETASAQLLRLINEVLDMSRIESGRIELEQAPFDLQELMDNMLDMTRAQLQAKGHTLQVQTQGLTHRRVVGDQGRLQQVCVNLMSNAIKYTPDGGHIRISLTEKPSGRESVGCYQWVFEDDGIGMTPEFLERIFEPFARAEDSRTSRIQGTGLGMTIAKSILDRMGGTIRVESQPNRGSRFTVTLCLKWEQADEAGEQTTAGSPERTRFPGKHVLVVEDNELNAEIAGELLSGTEAEVSFAADGRQAVELFSRSREGFYDLILMDIQMPVMDGYQATKAIRALPREDARRVPIVAMTANAFHTDVQMSMDAGMNAHLSKPVDLRKLMEVLNRWL